MKTHAYLVLIFCIFSGCKTSIEKISATKEPSHWVGDIPFNPKTDDPTFILCDSTNIIHRRNGLNYPGGKEAFKNECLKKFQPRPAFQNFSGYVMIRFLISCEKQKTNRYRAQSLDYDFSLKKSPPELEEHLISIVKDLDKWAPRLEKDSGSDFSKYLNFKIKNGQIENILH